MKPTDFGLTELRRCVQRAGERATDVSGWSVGMHIQHVSLAMIAVCRSLVASEPPVPHTRFHPVTWLIFMTGRIPRGRGRAPEQALPKEGVGEGELEGLLDECERLLADAMAAAPDTWFRHFAFGVLDRDRTLNFIRIHNRHHLRIVQDILRA